MKRLIASLVMAACLDSGAVDENLPPDGISWSQCPGCFSSTQRMDLTITPSQYVVELRVWMVDETQRVFRYIKPHSLASYRALKKRITKALPGGKARDFAAPGGDGPDIHVLKVRASGETQVDWIYSVHAVDHSTALSGADKAVSMGYVSASQTDVFNTLMNLVCKEIIASSKPALVKDD